MPTTTFDDPLSDRNIRELVARSSSVQLSEVPFSSLSKNTDLRWSFIQGEVTVKFPVQRTKHRTQMKIMLQQEGSSENLPVFMFGKSAEECQHLDTRDIVAISGGYVEENVRRSTIDSRWQITVDPEKMPPNIWILHRGRYTRSPSKNQTQGGRGPDLSTNQSDRTQIMAGPSAPRLPSQVAQRSVNSPRRGQSSTSNTASLAMQLPMSPADKANKPRSYTYTPINALQEGTVANVFGVISHVRPPAPTRRGNEFSFLVDLFDDSGDKHLKCMFFRQRPTEFPDVRCVGEIMRIHRVKIEMFNGRLQCIAHKGSCSLVFDGTVDAPLTPRSETQSYTLTPEDIDRVCELRTFYTNHDDSVVLHELPLYSNYTRDLATCQPGQSFNLVCQVVGMCVIRPSELVLLQVWDGTRPTFPLREDDLTKEGGDCLSRLVVSEELLAWAADLTVNIRVWDNHLATLCAVQVGDVLKLSGLRAIPYQPKVEEANCLVQPSELSLLRGTAGGRGITVLTPEHPEAIELSRKLDQLSTTMNSVTSQALNSVTDIEVPAVSGDRDQRNDGVPVCVPPPSQPESEANNPGDTVTVLTAHHDRPVSKVEDLFDHSVPYKFRVQCQVKEYLPVPTKPHDLVKLYCKSCHYITDVPENSNAPETIDSPIRLKTDDIPKKYSCPHCSNVPSTNVLDYVIILQFLLEDDTDWLVAGLWKADAEDFFNGTTATDILLDDNSFEFVRSQLERVCPAEGQELGEENDNSQRQGPVADCCLKSYSTATGTHYQIFATCVAWSDLDTSVM